VPALRFAISRTWSERAGFPRAAAMATMQVTASSAVPAVAISVRALGTLLLFGLGGSSGTVGFMVPPGSSGQLPKFGPPVVRQN
jgi:hypothetical protein